MYIYVLTHGAVAGVSVAGGRPIPTRANSTLPDGLREAVIELLGRKGKSQPRFAFPCPQMTAIDGKGRAIRGRGKPLGRLWVTLPGAKLWNAHPDPAREICIVAKGESRNACELPTTPQPGACKLIATRLPPDTTARRGAVATEIAPQTNLFGPALLSCVDTIYSNHEEDHLDAAVLLDAAHPGTTPPPLPGMTSLTGHPGIFKAPGAQGQIVARRIPGA
jgi:hypothetical protein